MKKREFISMIMAISMMISAASCGSADKASEAKTGGAAADTNGAVAEKSDDVAPAVESVMNGGEETIGAAEDKGEAPALSTTAAAREAAAEEAVYADGEPAAMVADYGTADIGMKKSAAKRSDGDAVINAADAAGEAEIEKDEAIAPPDIEPEVPDDPETRLVERPEAGQLTAGEWKDNENWGFFTNLVNSGTIRFPSFSLDPTTRCAVTVKNADDSPVANAKVRLLDESGNVIWRAVSDKQGRAYLFTSGSAVPSVIEAELDGEVKTAEYKAPETDEQGNKKASGSSAQIVMDGTGSLFKDMQVMFIVDTTGSMSDEMLFLQSEFSAITREIGTADTEYAVSFYRDEGDEYVTKHNSFTSSVDELQKALNNETADGGGDYPEAVAQVLTETFTKGNWKEDSVKLAFLIFDAPPHEGTERELLAAAKAACEKGIRIVPVVSSDSDRDTELFARSLAIMSGGTYVFLTDDSGIGGGHLEPIIGDHKVEKLYDIIIRVINEYKQ